MSLFAPIRGLCPPPTAAADVAELPYDVMDRAEAIEMAAGRPRSFLHVSRPDIDLPGDAPPASAAAYTLAAQAFAALQADGLLVRDRRAGFHAYRLTSGDHVQTGIVGGASVEAYDDGRIRRHETTRPDKQADRAAHIEAVGAQTGPVFLIHRESPAITGVLAAVTTELPSTRLVGPGGVRHELWPIHDAATIDALVTAFDDLPALYIADGHHRSAAASMVHQCRSDAAPRGGEQRPDPGSRVDPERAQHDPSSDPWPPVGDPRSGTRPAADSSALFLAAVFPADEVRIRPYNRLVRAPDGMSAEALLAGVGERFLVEPADGPVTPDVPGRFGLFVAGRWYAMTAPDRLRESAARVDQLDVAVLQRHILEPVLGISDPRRDPRIGFVGGVRPLAELEAAVASGRWAAAISMHPTTVADLMEVADAGGIMPPKSTWFEPKLLDGLVSHVLD